MDRWAAQEGTPSPLGVTWVEEEQAFNFALYSKHATGVTLLLYAANDVVTPASVSSVGGFIEQDHIAGGCISGISLVSRLSTSPVRASFQSGTTEPYCSWSEAYSLANVVFRHSAGCQHCGKTPRWLLH
jgi:hypothetical protein